VAACSVALRYCDQPPSSATFSATSDGVSEPWCRHGRHPHPAVPSPALGILYCKHEAAVGWQHVPGLAWRYSSSASITSPLQRLGPCSRAVRPGGAEQAGSGTRMCCGYIAGEIVVCVERRGGGGERRYRAKSWALKLMSVTSEKAV
jgi:hypothetical protein